MSDVVIRPAAERDFEALAGMDLRYRAGRVLRLTRSGEPPEHAFDLTWTARDAPPAVYAEYPIERLRRAMSRADAFFVAEVDGHPAGLLMIVIPPWTDAGEITDLAVDAGCRRRGAGRALVDAAMQFGRGRGLRGLWVEPRSDNADAIGFYVSLGFRLSGFNDRMYSSEDDADGRLTLFMYREL